MPIGSYQNCLLFISFVAMLNSASLAHCLILRCTVFGHGLHAASRLASLQIVLICPYITAFSCRLRIQSANSGTRGALRKTAVHVLLWRRLQNSEMDLKRLVTKCAEHCTLCVPATGTVRCLAVREM